MTKKSKDGRLKQLMRLGICVALIALIALVGAVMVSAEEPVYSEGLKFTSNGDGTCSVSGIGTCTDTDIVIPPMSPSGDKVTSIGSFAFFGCGSLTSITIPEGVTSIGSSAFNGCGSLTSITIPEGVTSIGEAVFSGCSGLTSITIPNSVTSIGFFAFYGCGSLTSITIPEGVTSIGSSAFYGCGSLTSITIPESVSDIGEKAFDGCTKLIEIQNGLKYVDKWVVGYVTGMTGAICRQDTVGIASEAFVNCSSLTSITIPEGVTSIGSYAFYGCSSLTSITIPEGVTSIGSGAFSYCSSLTSITIPKNVTSIGYGSNIFSYCTNLSSIEVDDDNPVYHDDGNCVIHTASKELITGCKDSVIPADGSVISIDDFAFYGCTGLMDIEIPDTITNIGMDAFYDCDGLTEIEIPDEVTHMGIFAFANCSNLTTANIPKKETSITWGLFDGCRNLTIIKIPVDSSLEIIAYESLCGISITSLYLPKSIKAIDPSAFYGCSNLTDIYYAGTEDEWKNIKTSLLDDAPGVNLPGINIHYNCYGDLTGASLTLGDSLTMNYYAKADPTCGTPAMRFTYRGKIDTVRGIPTEKDGEYVFSLKGIAPQCMGETIKAELIVILEDGTELVVDTKASYSVREYCDDALAANPDNETLATLLADLLAYGDAAQDYTGFNADTPVSDGFPVAPSEWEDVTDTDFTLSDKTRAELCFTAAGVRFGYVNRIYFKIKAADLTGVTVTVNGKTYTAEDLALVEDTADTYILYTDPVYATEFDKVFTAELCADGEVIQTLTYSVKSYVYAKQNGENAEMAALAKALYAYGRSAIAYKQEQ